MSSTPDSIRVSTVARLKELADCALKRWDLQVSVVDAIKVRENAVFRVTCRDGRRAVLRIHRRGYHSSATLRSEFEWADALRRSGIETPRAILSREGQVFEDVGAELGKETRQVDLLEWIDGVQLGSVEAGFSGDVVSVEEAYRKVGALAARMHNQAAAWSRPPDFMRHAWDLEGLVGERPLWGRFWELDGLSPAQRSLVDRTRIHLRRDLAEFGTAEDRFGLIHADLVPENVLVDGGRLAVIDFDDAGFGWHLFELATTLYFVRTEPFHSRAAGALVEGYRAHRPLPDSHLQRLPAFLAARGLTYLGWVHTRRGEQAAEELGPKLVELAISAAEEYLSAVRR